MTEFLRKFFSQRHKDILHDLEKDLDVDFQNLNKIRKDVYPLLLQGTANFDPQTSNLEVHYQDKEQGEMVKKIQVTDENTVAFLIGIQHDALEERKRKGH